MGELCTFTEREVIPKGARKGSKADLSKVKKHLFKEEFRALQRLKQIPALELREGRWLYPGCGSDILFPLFYLEKLFPKAEKMYFLLVDIYDNSTLIKNILDKVRIPFSEEKRKIVFYWKDCYVELEFRPGNIFELYPSLPAFDIYFERAFRIMKDGHENYEKGVFEKLAKGGILISDSGFKDVPLRRMKVPQELSAYGEMVLGVKE